MTVGSHSISRGTTVAGDRRGEPDWLEEKEEDVDELRSASPSSARIASLCLSLSCRATTRHFWNTPSGKWFTVALRTSQ